MNMLRKLINRYFNNTFINYKNNVLRQASSVYKRWVIHTDLDEPPPQSGLVAYTTPTNTTDLHKMGTKRVLITGFGPFRHVEINPSWEGVNCMNREQIERKYNIHFFQEKIEVVYSVDESLPKLWAKLQPDLTIHVGVKGDIQHFQLETQAAKEKYQIRDVQDACPVDFKHSSDGPDTICTDLDVDILCREFNSNPPAEGVTAKKSCEAGKYVCEYTYYTSLACCGRSKTLFVHVPHEGFSYELIAQGLERILEVCLGQLED